MKKIFFKITYAILLWGLLGGGCEKGDKYPTLEDKQLTVVEVNSGECKQNLKSTETEKYIELKAEQNNQLRVTLINATLNCCPGEITSKAYIKDEILRINFAEETPGKCNCICDFDLECVIGPMEYRSYTIEVYAGSDKAFAKFTFTYCSCLDSKIKLSN